MDNKGRLFLTEEHVDWFCEYLHCSDFSDKYKKALIKNFICGAIKRYIDLNKETVNVKSNNSKVKRRSRVR